LISGPRPPKFLHLSPPLVSPSMRVLRVSFSHCCCSYIVSVFIAGCPFYFPHPVKESPLVLEGLTAAGPFVPLVSIRIPPCKARFLFFFSFLSFPLCILIPFFEALVVDFRHPLPFVLQYSTVLTFLHRNPCSGQTPDPDTFFPHLFHSRRPLIRFASASGTVSFLIVPLFPFSHPFLPR